MRLSKQDTLFLKGIAILLLLYHHMFFDDKNIIIFNIARNFKVCVGLFVCLSGYGLTKNYETSEKGYKFIFKRLAKILPTYWIIFITTVSFGVLFNYRTLEEAYSNKIYLKTFLEFLGLHEFVYGHGYNATWWYMSLIIFFDFIFTYLILEFYVICKLKFKISNKIKCFIDLLGKYSYEIFLTHSFLFYYYFSKYIYNSD